MELKTNLLPPISLQTHRISRFHSNTHTHSNLANVLRETLPSTKHKTLKQLDAWVQATTERHIQDLENRYVLEYLLNQTICRIICFFLQSIDATETKHC